MGTKMNLFHGKKLQNWEGWKIKNGKLTKEREPLNLLCCIHCSLVISYKSKFSQTSKWKTLIIYSYNYTTSLLAKPLIFKCNLSTTLMAQPPPDLRSKSLILIKIWCLIVVFSVSFIAGISPYLIKWNEGFILLGTQFAGGIFLGTALMQFFSDSNEYFGKLSSKDYPFAPMLVSSGYLLTMLADCICIHVYRRRRSSDSGNTLSQDLGFRSYAALFM